MNLNLTKFVSGMIEAVHVGALVANELQPKVTNLKKPEESEKKQALTQADLAVQEILLNSLLQYRSDLAICCEEATSLVSKFAVQDSELMVVIDPVDGTLRYFGQDDSFGLQVGLVHRKEYVAAVVALPRLGILLAAEKGGGVVRHTESGSIPVRVGKCSNHVFCHDSVSNHQQERIRALGCEPLTKCGADITTSPVTGRAVAGLRPHKVSFFGRIGAMITIEAGGICCNRAGQRLNCITTDPLDGLLVAADEGTAAKMMSALWG